MDKDEFEKQLLEFEKNVRKKLPAMINITMASKGNREVVANFNFFIESLRRSRTAITRDLERYARPAQRMRFFNTINTMESLIRAMYGRNSIQERLRQKKESLSLKPQEALNDSGKNQDALTDELDRELGRMIDDKLEN